MRCSANTSSFVCGVSGRGARGKSREREREGERDVAVNRRKNTGIRRVAYYIFDEMVGLNCVRHR